MLICGDGIYPRVQPATAEQTSRQQITSLLSAPLSSTKWSPWLNWCWCRCSNSWVASQQVPRDPFFFFFFFFNFMVSHARRIIENIIILDYRTFGIQNNHNQHKYVPHEIGTKWSLYKVSIFDLRITSDASMVTINMFSRSQNSLSPNFMIWPLNDLRPKKYC